MTTGAKLRVLHECKRRIQADRNAPRCKVVRDCAIIDELIELMKKEVTE